ncbi:MAG: Type 1 glutamine amidotransferase-like domain-containing protein [Candidatus Dojkabacteria bacterium]|nr:Type 1 glutamine amidotransferase-like domain-containing protein [Candidatus Dojkabacteria bacterium]MDQ7020739.1 Type 1 glutamine amidotransferase-like domain-containing protein [Candidatus Dojkabacteria bacterium]
MNYILLSKHLKDTELLSKIPMHLNKSLVNLKIAYFTTAANTYLTENNEYPNWVLAHLDEVSKSFNGASISVLNIEDNLDKEYIKSNYDIIYFAGGTAAYLVAQIKKHSFEEVIRFFLENKLYIGSSAGSVVLTKYIYPYHIVEKDCEELQIEKNGLGILDFNIMVHWENSKYQENLKIVEAEYLKQKDSLIYLRDDEYFSTIYTINTKNAKKEGS